MTTRVWESRRRRVGPARRVPASGRLRPRRAAAAESPEGCRWELPAFTRRRPGPRRSGTSPQVPAPPPPAPPSSARPALTFPRGPHLSARGGGRSHGELVTSPAGGGAVGAAVQRRGAGRRGGGAGPAARDLAAGGRNPEKGVGGRHRRVRRRGGEWPAAAAGAGRSSKSGHASFFAPRPF